MKQHAFLLLVHKQPVLLARALRILEQDNHHFFVYVDKKNNHIEQFIEACKGIGNVHFLEHRVNVFHAGISIVLAELTLLEETSKSGISFDYYHLISGQDYPLRSNQQFDDFFERTDHSFMYFDTDDLRKQLAKNYDYCANEFHFNDTSTKFAKVYDKLHLGRGLKLFYHRAPIANYTGGWQWFSWNKKVKEFVVTYLQQHPEYLKRFNHTASADEHIFVTLLADRTNELGVEMQNPLRYVSWHAHRPVQTSYRPYNLTEEDYPFVINSKAFFCRKVDECQSAKLLDLIDAQRGTEYNIDEYENFV